MILTLIDEAVAAGARLKPACEILGLSEREEKRIVDTLTGTLERSRKM